MSRPVVAHSRAELRETLAEFRRAGASVGLVPTMGALHAGHASLLRCARQHVGSAGAVVASIFVNPLQFAAGEDLDRYPRTLEADLEICAGEGVDAVFVPSVTEMYPTWPEQPQITVEPGPLGSVLEGKTRPGHFRGVLTVVAKLFGLVKPDLAVFGQKDYQQLALVRLMVEDLCLGLEVIGAETVREPDGLAMSSRNRYLDPEQRSTAAALSRALRAAADDAVHGVDAALAAARAVLDATPGVDLDYLVITAPDLGELPESVPCGTPARALVAAKVGTTRLIDNLPLTIGRPD